MLRQLRASRPSLTTETRYSLSKCVYAEKPCTVQKQKQKQKLGYYNGHLPASMFSRHFLSFFLSLLVSLKLEHYTGECEFRNFDK